MSEEDFRFEGFHEFVTSLDKVAEEYSDTAEKHLKKTGNKLKKSAKAATPSGKPVYVTKDGKRVENKHYRHMKKRWKSEIIGLYGKDLEYQLRNTSPAFHLVDRGHVQKTPGGRVTGFVQGTHFFDGAVNAYEASGDYEKELEKFFDDVQKKLE